MKIFLVMLLLNAAILTACGNKEDKDASKNQIKEKVKEAVTQPFTTYDAAKDSLKASEHKAKSALDEADKELQR